MIQVTSTGHIQITHRSLLKSEDHSNVYADSCCELVWPRVHMVSQSTIAPCRRTPRLTPPSPELLSHASSWDRLCTACVHASTLSPFATRGIFSRRVRAHLGALVLSMKSVISPCLGLPSPKKTCAPACINLLFFEWNGRLPWRPPKRRS